MKNNEVYVLGSKKKEYYVAIPDNERQFYAYINMVINNRGNAHLPQRLDQVPKKVGPVPVTLTNNEVGEPYFIVNSNKDYCFVEMVKDQFCLLRSHWNMIQTFEQYPNASKY
jgi:hypothetical protein